MVKSIAEEKHFQIDMPEAQLIGAHIGVNLSHIDKELEKFRAILPEGGRITSTLIEQHIGISREYNAFEFANALMERNGQKIFDMIHVFSKNPKNYHPVMIIPIIYSTFLKIL